MERFLDLYNMTPFEREMTLNITPSLPHDLKNGILFFKCYGITFARSLSAYIENHKDIKIISVFPSLWNDGYGAHCGGYIVIIK
jgi:hypothetical protein